MAKDNILEYNNPANNAVSSDFLTDYLRNSAQKLLQMALEAEVDDFIERYKDQKNDAGHRKIVRNGYLPERAIQTGIGSIKAKVPRVRNRGDDEINFTSNFIPKYMRRTVTIDVLLPLLYLKGISTKDFADAFEPILGSNPKNLSPQVISRLKDQWYEQYSSWEKRDLSKKEYVYYWVDGVYLTARMESEKSCVLVIVGADRYGNKELVAMTDGFRESKESWLDLLRDLRSRGLTNSPKLSIGDGALGFWGALNEIYPESRHQRCWVHKLRNLLNKLPKSSQEQAKKRINDIYMAETKEAALQAYNSFISYYGSKFPKVVECLEKDKDKMLTFYDFPAEHWTHIRTTNPVESAFATVRHRTKKSKNCFSRRTILASVFKLFLESQKRWAKLKGRNKLPEVINMEKFINGINEKTLNDTQNSANNNDTSDNKYDVA